MKVTMYAATGILGYGFPEESLNTALKQNPAFLGCDCGSCDPGPNYLGMGKAICSRQATKRDARLLVKAALSH
ncbi:MAG: 3-methylaspartate ammonia-lyase, partial [Spirochaetales bacterium]|nr:3-methylaspartate ammonia-lyase [Spirochaetales bacterium]